MSKRFLVAGFEPYGGRTFNPAGDVARALDGREIAGTSIIGRQLPVSLQKLRGGIESLLREFTPSAVIGLGLHPGEQMVRVECVGVNEADFEIPDNDGVVVQKRKLSPQGPARRRASFPAQEIVSKLLAAGILARLSVNAGRYLCNACLYTCLELLEEAALPVPCGFIHLPYAPEQVAEILSERTNTANRPKALASMDLRNSTRAVEIAIAETVRIPAQSR
jgi:pyroglutamyl-peptidase